MLLRTSFPYKEISEGCTFLSGFAFKSEEFSEEGIPVVKIKNIQNNKVDFKDSQFYPESFYQSKLDKFKVYHKDVLIAMTGQGSVGRVGQLKIDENKFGLLNQRVGKFICDEQKLNRDYLFYILTSDRYQEHLFDKAVGSGQPNLSPSDITSVEIPFPIYEEQCAIASILSAIDDKIELNLQMNKTLEEMAMALYKHWFVDFGPFQDGEFVDSELGMIPKGWEVKSIAEFGKVVCGKTPSTKDDNNFTANEGYPFIKIPDMHGKVFVVETTDYISEIGNKLQMKKLLPSGCINVSCIATVGLVTINAFPAHTNQQINSILPEKTFSRYYLYFSMLSLKDRFLNEASGGSATLNMNTSTFAGIQLLNPIDEVLKRFDLLVSAMFENILQNQNENQTLTTLRDTLLPKLISGEVRVKEAAEILEEVI